MKTRVASAGDAADLADCQGAPLRPRGSPSLPDLGVASFRIGGSARTSIWLSICLCLVAAGTAMAQISTSVINSPHNLSATGPGKIKAGSEAQVCIFCHTPHSAASAQPLWNRKLSAASYTVYKSKTLWANVRAGGSAGTGRIGQPTGASKLCLSCHDGTIALGNIVSRNQQIGMAQGMTVLPAGHTNLGTDLSDDHPVSFRYDSVLYHNNKKLWDPATASVRARLDSNHEVQCTSCHNAHDNSNLKFLVMANTNSELCNTCHNPGTTTVTGHAQCAGCHQQHTAPSGPWLLTKAKVADTCAMCHSGGTGTNQGVNVMADIAKTRHHETYPAVNNVDHSQRPAEADCTDCHGKHTMTKNTASAPYLSGRFGKIPGVSSGGAPLAEATREYEVCFRCHGKADVSTPIVTRQTLRSTLADFTTAASYHPVVGPGKNLSDVPSLKSGLTTSSMIYCSDCHGSESGKKAGGAGPDGVHGSTVAGLLAGNYPTISTGTSGDSENKYSLCYRCHDRSILMSGNSAFPLHSKHVVEKRQACSFCHDPHGSDKPHLINYDKTFLNAPMTYTQTSRRHGTCNGKCHSSDVHNKSY